MKPKQLSRVDGAAEDSDDPLLAELYGRIRAQRGRILTIHRVVGHAPKLLRAQAAYAAAMREESSLARDFQELLILRVAQVNDSAYEQSVHRPIALRLGVPAAKLDALPSWHQSALFDAKERAALAYVEQAARTGEVDDPTFAEVRQFFSARQIVELTALVAWYVGNARFVRSLRIAPEREEN
ncbi:MAG: carboxymuconolactone decarboxylase family protein [Xanthobacteraceae bacterium]